MYKNKFVSELPINEVKEYFDELRCSKNPWTAEESADFAICRERLVVQACKTIEQINVLDKIRAEITDTLYVDSLIFGKLMDFKEGKIGADDVIEEFNRVTRLEVLKIIDKYRKEQTDDK